MNRYECESSAGPNYGRHTTVRIATSEREAAEQVVKAYHAAWWVGDKKGNEWPFMAGGRCVGGVRIKLIGGTDGAITVGHPHK